MKKKTLATLCVLGMAAFIGIFNMRLLSAGESGAGSAQDPVVTKSYVDRLVESLKTSGTGSNTSNNIGNNIYEVIELGQGKALIGKQGTEIILRAGEGKAIISDKGGLQDITQGTDITQGSIPKYHLIVTPRDDGRGIFVTKDAVFMVRGAYTVE